MLTHFTVDDNADMRRYIKSLFSSFCKVIEAVNGEEALAMVPKIKPDLIISDVMMPGALILHCLYLFLY
jgi:CheY-like chemotaxis protein